MDILTQALLGGVLAQSVADKSEKKLATIAGAVSGLVADADVFIKSANDPLLNIEFHRHFSHSIFFIPFGALLALLLLWPFLRTRLSIKRLYIFCLAGYSLSGVLDACTSYGTHLFWPLSNERVAWNLISIVDPVFTLVLLSSLILGLKLRQRNLAKAGLMLAVLYMGLGLFQLQRAETVADALANSRGHLPEQHVVKPSLANLLLWRSVYIYENEIYVDAVRVGVFTANKVYEGARLKRFSADSDMAGLDKNSVLYKDIERFRKFSNGYIAFDPVQPNVIGDIRYSILPDNVKPLWGIVINTAHPDEHVEYRFFREHSQEQRDEFFSMLSGS